ncbi:hypothetical protein Tco_1576334 [Tanacetum coccineum]
MVKTHQLRKLAVDCVKRVFVTEPSRLLQVVYYVLEGPPIGMMTEEEQRKHEQDETLYRGYILSTLTDRLYDLYTPMTSAREIWNSLKEKYTTEKEGTDKFITFRFFEFSMEDNVSILDQVHEFLILVSKFKNLNIEIP